MRRSLLRATIASNTQHTSAGVCCSCAVCVRFVCVLYAGVCGSCAFCMLACAVRVRFVCWRVGVEVLRTSACAVGAGVWALKSFGLPRVGYTASGRVRVRVLARACACAGVRVRVRACAGAGGSISHRSRSAKVFAPPSFYFIFTSHTHTLPSLFRKCKREKVERVE